MIEKRAVSVCTCERCGREFVPLRCPECKNTSWNQANPKRGRPKKETITEVQELKPMEELSENNGLTSTGEISNEAPVVMKPDTRRVAIEETLEERRARGEAMKRVPIKRQSFAKAKPIEANRPAGKIEKCRHGFFIVDGVSACKQCR